MMEPAVEKFRVAAGKVDMNAPAIPVISNLSGTWLTDEQATDAD